NILSFFIYTPCKI
ncbi:putative membrane protein, partial [Vibrio parahaemolyticus V-223/04]